MWRIKCLPGYKILVISQETDDKCSSFREKFCQNTINSFVITLRRWVHTIWLCKKTTNYFMLILISKIIQIIQNTTVFKGTFSINNTTKSMTRYGITYISAVNSFLVTQLLQCWQVADVSSGLFFYWHPHKLWVGNWRSTAVLEIISERSNK